MCVLHYNASFNVCVHVWAGSHVCFASDGALTAVAEVECALTVDRVLVCVCTRICVSAWLVCFNGADACWGWTLRRCPVVSHLEKLSVLLDTFWTWGKKEGIDRFFVLTVVFIFLLEFTNIASTWWRVCACVSPVWVSSLLGVHSESQSFGSHACQLLFSPLFSSVFHALRGWVLHVPAGEGWSWCDRVYSCASVWVYK